MVINVHNVLKLSGLKWWRCSFTWVYWNSSLILMC